MVIISYRAHLAKANASDYDQRLERKQVPGAIYGTADGDGISTIYLSIYLSVIYVFFKHNRCPNSIISTISMTI